MTILALLTALQLQLPDPVGFVNDFAGVVTAADEQTMTAVIEEVRQRSRGEIVVVTLADLGGRAPAEVARDIGRAWGVGSAAGIGDAARNAGVVLLLRPGERPGDGNSDLFIATGTGSEGFITDARAGRIRDAIGRAAVETGSFSRGLVTGVRLLAEAYAAEFDFELTGAAARPPARERPGMPPIGRVFVIMAVLFFIVASAGAGGRRRYYGGRHRGSAAQWILLSMLMSGRHGRHRHGGSGGWGGGGFGGGGFGGFGGGGGFSGGGAGGSF